MLVKSSKEERCLEGRSTAPAAPQFWKRGAQVPYRVGLPDVKCIKCIRYIC